MAALNMQEAGILCENVKQYPVMFDKQRNAEKKMLWPVHGMQWQKK